MNKKLRAYVCVFIVCAIGALLMLFTSCIRNPNNRNAATTLILVREIVNENGLKCNSSIRVHQDGSYLFEYRGFTPGSKHIQSETGQLSTELLGELRKLASSDGVMHTNGTPLYDYFPENSYITPPKPINNLLEAVIK